MGWPRSLHADDRPGGRSAPWLLEQRGTARLSRHGRLRGKWMPNVRSTAKLTLVSVAGTSRRRHRRLLPADGYALLPTLKVNSHQADGPSDPAPQFADRSIAGSQKRGSAFAKVPAVSIATNPKYPNLTTEYYQVPALQNRQGRSIPG